MDMDDRSLEDRIDQLERTAEQWRWLTFVAFSVALLSLGLAWRVQPDTDGWITARGFIVRGSHGGELARLGALPAENGAALTLHGRETSMRVMLSGDDAQASMVMFGRESEHLILQPTSGHDWAVRWISSNNNHQIPLWKTVRR